MLYNITPDTRYIKKFGNFNAVCYYRRCGLNVMPLWANGSKAPKIKWKPYQLSMVPESDIRDFFEPKWKRDPCGIGVICGVTSKNLEILDFDDDKYFEPWFRQVKAKYPGLLDDTPIVITPSGGHHVYWRCSVIEPNQKLAEKPIPTDNPDEEKAETLIETRGQGGQGVLPLSPPETHPSGRQYYLQSGDFGKIVELTPEQRAYLLDTARCFNQFFPKSDEYIYKPDGTQGTRVAGRLPGHDFNERGSWEDILIPAKWKFVTEAGGMQYWCRPDKSSGVSASTGGAGDRFYVFSTNARPFEHNKSYSKFAAYTLINQQGDWSKAAAALSAKGFGGWDLIEQEESLQDIIKRIKP